MARMFYLRFLYSHMTYPVPDSSVAHAGRSRRARRCTRSWQRRGGCLLTRAPLTYDQELSSSGGVPRQLDHSKDRIHFELETERQASRHMLLLPPQLTTGHRTRDEQPPRTRRAQHARHPHPAAPLGCGCGISRHSRLTRQQHVSI